MLHHLLKRVLEIDPARPILESDGAWTTAADLERLASGLAAMGLEEGDRVALLLPNCLETVVCYLACFRMHLVAVPLDYQYHPLQVGYALGHSGASVLLRVTLTPDDVALIATSISRPWRSAARFCLPSGPGGESACCERSPSNTSSRPCGGSPPRRSSRSRRGASGS